MWVLSTRDTLRLCQVVSYWCVTSGWPSFPFLCTEQVVWGMQVEKLAQIQWFYPSFCMSQVMWREQVCPFSNKSRKLRHHFLLLLDTDFISTHLSHLPLVDGLQVWCPVVPKPREEWQVECHHDGQYTKGLFISEVLDLVSLVSGRSWLHQQ